MTDTYVLTIAQNAIYVGLLIAGPVLLISLLVGVLVSIFQAATQINEITLTFIPKMIGIIAVIVILGSWMLDKITSFTVSLFNNLPNLVH